MLHALNRTHILRALERGWIRTTELAHAALHLVDRFVLMRFHPLHQALFDVASNASGQCWALTTNCPVPGPVPTSPANRDYQPGFAVLIPPLIQAYDALPATNARKAGLAGAIATLRGWDYRWSAASVPTSLAVYWARRRDGAPIIPRLRRCCRRSRPPPRS